MRTIRLSLNETAGFFVRRGDAIEAVASEIGTQTLRYAIDTGHRAPIHAFAAGKAILASLPPEELDAYFATSDRPPFTPARSPARPGCAPS